MRLIQITNAPDLAGRCESVGVDWVMVDLEIHGKVDRQKSRDTLISSHDVEDIGRLRHALSRSRLVVRVNPIGPWSEEEISKAIGFGADIIMLPFFSSLEEVETFLAIVDRRVQVCLLVETVKAVALLETLVDIDEVDFVHIGLNDLHIERQTDFMFEFLSDGSLDEISRMMTPKQRVWGFGGIASVGQLKPAAEDLLAEHCRLKSSGVILSRSFCNSDDFDSREGYLGAFEERVQELRKAYREICDKPSRFFEQKQYSVKKDIQEVVAAIRSRQK